MTRSITRTLPFLAVLLLVFAWSTPSYAQLLGGKRHYNNRMYVKTNKQKQQAEKQTTFSESAVREADGLAMVPPRKASLGDNETRVSPVQKLEQQVASVLPRVHKKQTTPRGVEAPTFARSNAIMASPTVSNAVDQRVPANVDQEISDDVTNVLVILGLILIIVAVVALILEVATAGWLGLLIAGLLIILLAYLLF